MQNFVQIRAKMAELRQLKQNFKMAAAAILDFVGSQIWWQKYFRDSILRPCVKFGANTCNSGRVIKISSKFQNGGRHYLGSQIWQHACFWDVLLSDRAKFCANTWKNGRVTADKAKFLNGGRRHLGFCRMYILMVVRLLLPHFESLCRIWCKYVQKWLSYGS